MLTSQDKVFLPLSKSVPPAARLGKVVHTLPAPGKGSRRQAIVFGAHAHVCAPTAGTGVEEAGGRGYRGTAGKEQR